MTKFSSPCSESLSPVSLLAHDFSLVQLIVLLPSPLIFLAMVVTSWKALIFVALRALSALLVAVSDRFVFGDADGVRLLSGMTFVYYRRTMGFFSGRALDTSLSGILLVCRQTLHEELNATETKVIRP